MAISNDNTIDKITSSIGTLNVAPAMAIVGVDIGTGLQSAYNLANSTTNLVTGAYALANSDANLVASAFAEANGFQSIINSAFTLANSTTNLVAGAYAEANSTTNLVASAFAEANGFQSVINSSFTAANSAGNLSSSAYARANAAVQNQFTVTATGGVAVGGGSTVTAVGNTTIALTANAGSTTVVGVVQLNDTFTSTSTSQAATANVANTIWTNHQAAFLAVNSATNLVASAFAEANGFQSVINSAFTLANSASNLSSSAYGRANAAIQNQLTVTATGGVAVNAGSTATVTGNNTIALTANAASTTVVGVVQLNDTFTSTSTTQAATANVANTIWTTVVAAFAKANTVVGGGISNPLNATLTVNNLTSNVGINTGVIFANANVTTANLTITNNVVYQGNLLTFVTLTDSVTSTSTITAATANSVNAVMLSSVQDSGDRMTGTLTVPNLTSNVGINTATLISNTFIAGSVTIGIGGVGVTQGAAQKINSQINIVFVSGAGANSGVLPTPPIGTEITIVNNGATGFNIFPPVGHGIDSLGLNANTNARPAGFRKLVYANSIHWYTTANGVYTNP